MTTTSKQLPPELLSLVHHIELHRSGWWDKALRQLMLYVLWMNDGFMTVEEVGAAVADTFTISVDMERLYMQLEQLETSDRVIKSAAETYKVTEEQIASLQRDVQTALQRDVQTAQDVEGRVRLRFIEQVSSVCPEINPGECWNEFNQQCLVPLVLEMGAKTYDFLARGTRPKELILS